MRALPSSAEKTYTVFECAQILRIGTVSTRRLILRKELPAHKFKREWRIKVDDLREYQSKHPVQTATGKEG